MSSQEPAVFFATVALGLAEQASEPVIHTSLARPRHEAKTAAAFQMYSKANTCLRKPMELAIASKGPLGPIVLSCVLFLVFEVAMGHTLNALRHGRLGKSVLDERLIQVGGRHTTSLQTSSSCLRSQNPGPPWNDQNLGYSALDLDNPISTLKSPARFVSLQDARLNLEILMDTAQQLREKLILQAHEIIDSMSLSVSTASRFCLTHTFSRTMNITATLQRQLSDVLHDLTCWGKKFWLMFHSREFISQDLFFLQIRFFYASFTLAMCRASSERLADTFADQFVRTLDSAERILRQRPRLGEGGGEETTVGPVAIEFMEKLSITDTGQPSDQDAEHQARMRLGPFPSSDQSEDRAAGIFEFGILPSVFAIACRCRDSALRHRAAQLLADANRVEAVISSRALSMYAKAIIQLEESTIVQSTGLSSDEPGLYYADEVGEQERFLDVVAHSFPEKTSVFTLSFTKRVSQDSEDVVLHEYECNDQSGHFHLLDAVQVHFARAYA